MSRDREVARQIAEDEGYFQVPKRKWTWDDFARDMGFLLLALLTIDNVIVLVAAFYLAITKDLAYFWAALPVTVENVATWTFLIAGVMWMMRILSATTALSNRVTLWALQETERANFLKIYMKRMVSVRLPQYVALAAFILMILVQPFK